MHRILALVCATSLASPLGASDIALPFSLSFTLSWPVDCTLGQDCHIQQYVDHAPGPQAQDFMCQSLTYDGHKGTDIALPSLARMDKGVEVLAAAPGTVTAVRDTMPDVAFSPPNSANVAGRECGNGLVIRHADGWESQYCHMKRGSLLVTPGTEVTAGTPLGQVGLSGQTQFPHLHLSLRHAGQVIDPFAPQTPPPTGHCSQRPPGQHLWADDIAYAPGGVIATGFATAVPAYNAVKAGTAAAGPTLPSDAPALVLWGYAFGGREGDRVRLLITGPTGTVLDHHEDLSKAQAQFFRAAGKRRPTARTWPLGEYTGTVELLRKGKVIDRSETRIFLN